jgi:polysaccharide biosynthesis transport protein
MSSAPQLPGTAPPGDDGQAALDVRYYLSLLWRGRVVIATTGLVGLALGLFLAFLQTPEYRAAALVQIEPPTPLFMNVQDAVSSVSGYWQNADFYNTQFKILRSTGVGDKVVQRLGLTSRPPFKDSPTPAAVLMSKVSVEPVPDSRLVSVVVIHENASEAAQWANAITDAYIELSLAGRVETTKKAYEWLQDRLQKTQGGWREAQEKLIKGLDVQGPGLSEGGVAAVSRSITKLNDDYLDVHGKRLSLEAVLNQINAMRQRKQSLDAVPQIATDQAVTSYNNQLVERRFELSKLKERYKEGHPEVQKVLGEIAEATRAKEARIAAVVEAVRIEYAQLQRRETELVSAIDKEKSQAADQSRKITEFEILRREADTAKGIYDVLLQKMNESDIAASLRQGNQVTVVERAVPPRSPVRPDKRKIASTGLALGLLLGVSLILLRDYFDNTLKDPAEVESYLHTDLLASVPSYDESTVHFVTEAYQNLRTALIFARKDEGGQVVLVTGTVPQEGKTTTLINVGKLMAAAGEKTLVIDFDLRRATLHTSLGLTREPGVTDHFVSHAPLDSIIRPTRVANLYALTAGPLPPNPPALLARKALGNLLAELRQHFEWILLDSPPLASVTDAVLLARHADATVMIVRHNKADKRLVKKTIASLRKATPGLLGVVFNAVDIRSKGYYYQYYYYGERAERRARARRATDAPRAAL